MGSWKFPDFGPLMTVTGTIIKFDGSANAVIVSKAGYRTNSWAPGHVCGKFEEWSEAVKGLYLGGPAKLAESEPEEPESDDDGYSDLADTFHDVP